MPKRDKKTPKTASEKGKTEKKLLLKPRGPTHGFRLSAQGPYHCATLARGTQTRPAAHGHLPFGPLRSASSRSSIWTVHPDRTAHRAYRLNKTRAGHGGVKP